jgi:hypothetical protein
MPQRLARGLNTLLAQPSRIERIIAEQDTPMERFERPDIATMQNLRNLKADSAGSDIYRSDNFGWTGGCFLGHGRFPVGGTSLTKPE